MSKTETELIAPSHSKKTLNKILSFAFIAFGLSVWLRGCAVDGGVAHFWIGLIAFAPALYFYSNVAFDDVYCPNCGEKTWFDSKDEFKQCPKCKEYLQNDKRKIHLVPEDFIATAPTFKLKIPEKEFYVPKVCCVCSEAPTRTIHISNTEDHTGRNAAVSAIGIASLLAGGPGGVMWGGSKTIGFDLYYCDEHTDGAKLEDGGEILFKSNKYYKKFKEINSIKD